MNFSSRILTDILVYLFAVRTVVSDAVNHKYQQSPLYVYLGECVNFTAKSYFSTIERASANVKIVWKKDTQLLKKGGAWVYINYAKFTDAGFYQVEVLDTVSNVKEETFFWLNVQACKPHEKESPEQSAKCKSSCAVVCSSGWSYFNSPNGDRCYKYFGNPKTWAAAQDTCQAVGGELAAPGSLQENRFVGSLMKSAAGGWIGLNDRKSESSFVWNYAKSSDLKYTSWATGEPNNYNAKCNIENCVMMSKASGKWSDVICNAFNSFVCEKSYTNVTGWKCLDAKCFQLFEEKVMWHDAKAACELNGASLVTINSLKENDYINSITRMDIWIGLNDIAEAGSFVWNQVTYDSRKPPFTNWASNEPNDMLFSKAYANSCNGEDCVILKEWQSKTLWYDNDCENKKPFVCEKFRDSLVSLGLLIGIIIGSMIGVAIGAGIINSQLKKRDREHMKAILLNAFERDCSEMRRQEELPKLSKLSKQPTKRR